MIKIYDSRTNKLIPLDDEIISIYNCGPTVYNHIHIGNARPLVTFDVLVRLLKYKNKEYKYVLNITDIDDKIINEAQKQNKTEIQLSTFYMEQYFEIKNKLNTLPMINPRVSDNIDGIINYVDLLLEKGAAYIEDGDVYFDTTFSSTYGEISKRKPDELLNGARVDIDHKKHHPNDFVLWKKTDLGIKWETNWSTGRPGWHSECSYLINKLIGKQVTIHGGGMDLKFPHHENENAQNHALHDCSLAKIWMHIGMININNEKMSKSLNNFILVKDILNKYSYQALRWFFYQSGYSNPLNYSDEIMSQMELEITKLRNTINIAKTTLILNNFSYQSHNKITNDFEKSLENNLNLNNAITEIYKVNKELNIAIKNKDTKNINELMFYIINMLDIMGINFDNIHTSDNIELIKNWNKLIINKDYENADSIRDILKQKGLL
ncbi:MAG: cysteine--tRNA ligase [Candidatus Ureaplasma intestinipullorum]|uniref:Cysteine--tRNA ligase n=1 Tax=Candidatus Ureaplasma intestinipullorum TaxID=2838770 RepID=A0A9E2KVM7_9BACT|nr:cysteine--tRNA ligase [Candidatus Ureaplasma intestinipullorum]